LGNPYAEKEYIPAILQPLAASRLEANRIKREEPITVVIGNPPYRERAKGLGGWIESGTGSATAPLKTWIPPPEWKVSAHAKHLRNLYVYFWRWATWKVFGEGAPADPKRGVISFITVAGFLNGPGFEKMRADLRRDASEIWVIDCSPEGHQSAVANRIFQGVQHPVCIVTVVRLADADPKLPAPVRFRALPPGHREDKFTALQTITLDGPGLGRCAVRLARTISASGSRRVVEVPQAGGLFRLQRLGRNARAHLGNRSRCRLAAPAVVSAHLGKRSQREGNLVSSPHSWGKARRQACPQAPGGRPYRPRVSQRARSDRRPPCN
jgi:hypothetical protein